MGFAIWSIVALLFLIIGLRTWKSQKPVGFFTFSEAPDVKDVTKYNHAVSILWMTAAVLLELLGVPLLFLEQNAPQTILIIFGTVGLMIAMMIAYTRIEARYRNK